MTDTELIRQTLSGDTDAFGRLIRRHQGAVQGLAYGVMGSFEDAQDVAQEAFVRAYLKLHQLRHPERLSAWLRQLTLNGCRSWMRKRRETAPFEDVESVLCHPGASPAEALERAETRRLVRCALGRLTEKNRLVIALRYLGDLSYRDIARFLDVPLRTVEGRMHRARQQLKGHIMKKVENTLKNEQLSEDFARQVLDEAVQKAKAAQKGWAKDDFMRSCQEALEAAARLEDERAQVELLSMRGEAEATWLGEPAKAVGDYELALKMAKRQRHEAKAEEADILGGLYVAHVRHGAFDKMRDRAQEALERFEALGDRENAAQARAALDLAEALPGAWQPGQKGGYAMAAFPIRTGEDGIEFLDPKSVRNYSWGCPSRCAALAHLLRPRRLLGPSHEVGAMWEDRVLAVRDNLSWGIDKGEELTAKAEVEGADDTVVTPAGRFEGCLRARVVILPEGGGTAAEHSTRSFCGTRTLWFAPGVGLVKLRHEDQNHTVWAVFLTEYEGGGGTDYFPLKIGRRWRYRWLGGWRSKEVFDDISRIHSRDGDVAYVSSATWGVEHGEKALSFLEEIAEAERSAGDLAGEAAALEKIFRMLDVTEGDRKQACCERLVAVCEAIGDEWKLLEARRLLAVAKEDLSPEEEGRWLEEKLTLARRLDHRQTILEALRGLAWHQREQGAYEEAAAHFEEVADIADSEGDIRGVSRFVAGAELAREMAAQPPCDGVDYVHGDAYLVEKQPGRMSEEGSTRSGTNFPPGPKGSPMFDLFQNGPFNGIELLADDVGSSATDFLNTSIVSGFCESMRMVSTLVGKEESVAVDAGAFDGCALIETVISTSGEDRHLGEELERGRKYYAGKKKVWFAPGVGMVRLLYQHENGRETDIQLVSYDIPDGEIDYLPLAIGNRWRYRWTDPETGTLFEDSLRMASHRTGQWNIAFVTRATVEVG